MLLVKYSAAPASDETQLWYLTKVFGRQILIMVHAESPRSVSVNQRDVLGDDAVVELRSRPAVPEENK
jgi:hypothetical protein